MIRRDMDNIKTKYIIKFAVSNTNKRYIRRVYRNNSPMLTPNPNMVDIDCTFNKKVDAVKLINSSRDHAHGYVVRLRADKAKLLKTRISPLISDRLSTSIKKTCAYIDTCTDLRKYERRADITNYTVEKYTPSFVCNTNRKRSNNTWKDDGSAKTFCTCCGSNIYYGNYAMLGSVKVCPFCIKGLGDHANVIIEKLKKEDAKIEDNYNCSLFVANM